GTVGSRKTGKRSTDPFTVTTVQATAHVITITRPRSTTPLPYTTLARSSVVEAGGVGNGTAGTPTASGTLTDSDVDNTPNTFTAAAGESARPDCRHVDRTDAGGGWSDTLDNDDERDERLKHGPRTTVPVT